MAIGSLLCAAICALGPPLWCHCAAALGNPELKRSHGGRVIGDCGRSMGPGFAAPECEIVGIGGLPAGRLLRLQHLVGNPPALAISDGLFLGVEANADLLL